MKIRNHKKALLATALVAVASLAAPGFASAASPNAVPRYADGTPLTHHVITNLIVEPEPLDQVGDATGVVRRWRARSCFTVFQATDDLPLAPIVAGRYRDVVDELADGTWRFRERSMEPLLLGTLDQHLLIDL